MVTPVQLTPSAKQTGTLSRSVTMNLHRFFSRLQIGVYVLRQQVPGPRVNTMEAVVAGSTLKTSPRVDCILGKRVCRSNG